MATTTALSISLLTNLTVEASMHEHNEGILSPENESVLVVNLEYNGNISYWFDNYIVLSVNSSLRPVGQTISHYVPGMGTVSGYVYPVNPSAYRVRIYEI